MYSSIDSRLVISFFSNYKLSYTKLNNFISYIVIVAKELLNLIPNRLLVEHRILLNFLKKFSYIFTSKYQRDISKRGFLISIGIVYISSKVTYTTSNNY